MCISSQSTIIHNFNHPPYAPPPHPNTRITVKMIIKITILVDPFGHYYYILNLSVPCPRVEKRRNIAFSHNYNLSLSNLCLEVEKKIFKEIMHFYYMTYIATP